MGALGRGGTGIEIPAKGLRATKSACADWVEVLLLPLAVAWDGVVGEPPGAVHPVVWMGKVVRAGERGAPKAGAGGHFVYGVGLAVVPPVVYGWVIARAWRWVGRWPLVALAVGVPLLKSMFAIRMLREAGEGVRGSLEAGDLDGARLGLRSLVSRDASGLDGALVAAAAVESLAENLGDSVVAPLFCYAVGGLPGVVAYRAVNTLDSMIGYRGRYEWLGKAGARLDDLLNLLPSRLAALLIVGAAAVVGEDARGAWRMARRDAGLTASPNAGWPMAAMAGALGVELEKVGHYRLGAGGAAADAAAIRRADRVVGVASLLAVALACGVRAIAVRQGGRWVG